MARTLECWPSVDYLIVASELQNKVTIFLHRKRAKQDVELEHYNDCGNRLNSQLLNIQLLPITVFISFFPPLSSFSNSRKLMSKIGGYCLIKQRKKFNVELNNIFKE